MLCVALRDHRAVLPPLFDPRATANPEELAASGAGRAGRNLGIVLPRRPELAPATCSYWRRTWRLVAETRRRRRRSSRRYGKDSPTPTTGELLRRPWRSAATGCPVLSRRPPLGGCRWAAPMSHDSSLVDASDWPEQSAPTDAAGATEAYDRAEEALYRRVGSSRGVAHVAWRRAYLLFATGDERAGGRRTRRGGERARRSQRAMKVQRWLPHSRRRSRPCVGAPSPASARWWSRLLPGRMVGLAELCDGDRRMYQPERPPIGLATWSCELSLTAVLHRRGNLGGADRRCLRPERCRTARPNSADAGSSPVAIGRPRVGSRHGYTSAARKALGRGHLDDADPTHVEGAEPGHDYQRPGCDGPRRAKTGGVRRGFCETRQTARRRNRLLWPMGPCVSCRPC